MNSMHNKFMATSVGKKYLMAITGVIWAGFVFAHMTGNLLLLVSPSAYNAYGHILTSGNLIYAVEFVLIIALITHVACAISLTRVNRASGGVGRYALQANGEKAPKKASKSMAVQGSIILVFLITHISTFKYGTYYETTVNGVVMRDLHRLILEVFHQPGYVFWYLVALFIIGFHLSHGVASVFQSLGLRNDRFARLISKVSMTYAVVVAAGFIIQPIYVFFLAK